MPTQFSLVVVLLYSRLITEYKEEINKVFTFTSLHYFYVSRVLNEWESIVSSELGNRFVFLMLNTQTVTTL